MSSAKVRTDHPSYGISEEEVKRIVQIAILESDLSFTKELWAVKEVLATVPATVASAVAACQDKHSFFSRWKIERFMSFLAILISAAAMVLNFFKLPS